MNIFDILVNPFVAVGFMLGVICAAGLGWLFPNHDLVIVQALVIVAFTLFGMIVNSRTPKDR